MPMVDPENNNMLETLLTLLGFGGGGYKLITHETRLRRMETDRAADVLKLDQNISDVSELKGTLHSVETTVNEIKNILLGKGLK